MAWTVAGVESFGHSDLRALRSRSDWPVSHRWEGGLLSSALRKGLAHAAVSVLRPAGEEDRLGVRLRWAVFLPLDDDPDSQAGSIVERIGPSPAWEILLHGYFWPSQDRRSIPGVTDDLEESAADMRTRWNRAIRDRMLLPLLPDALARAVRGVEEDVSRSLIDAVAESSVVQRHSGAVTERAVLLPFVGRDGMAWESRPLANLRVLSIPGWRDASETIRERFASVVRGLPDNVVFIDDDAPRLAPRVAAWPPEYFEHLVSSIGNDAFGSARDVRWLTRVLAHVCRLSCGPRGSVGGLGGTVDCCSGRNGCDVADDGSGRERRSKGRADRVEGSMGLSS